MNEHRVKIIDMLCWSHPDEDHTKGIDLIINKFCDNNTKIILPQGLNGKDYDVIDYNRGDKAIINKIIRLNARKQKCQLTSSVTPYLYQPMEMITFSDYPDEINVQIHTLSPHSSLINERIGNDKGIKKNELSIALYIEIAKYKFVFCSDIENPTINNIMTECFDNPAFVKIPHHTSMTSSNLLYILNTNRHNTLGCTTIYKQHNLPNIELLEQYKRTCSEVHTTGSSKKQDFGIIEYEFNLFNSQTVKIKCHGHASKVS